jgi:hypothetical protein
LVRRPVWSQIFRRWEMPDAPLTGRRYSAMPETIDGAYLAAVTARTFERERAHGVMAMLDWSWHGSRRPPLEMRAAAVG